MSGPHSDHESGAPEHKSASHSQLGAHDHMPHGSFDSIHHPHGYRHPTEKHHWPWYLGIGICALLALIVPWLYIEVEGAKAPICEKLSDEVLTSPDGEAEMELARVSCFGGTVRQKVFMRHLGQGSASEHVVASFDDQAHLRMKWLSDHEVVITKSGGKIWTFQPVWKGTRIRYVL